ncbi:hypothetical protein [Agromyces sp. ZXT2-6]|uniref:hypothetical protein n=1 Tax=Agromyces sp. ZXT2-6 TaxID=3461153 RepID=UPI004054D30A
MSPAHWLLKLTAHPSAPARDWLDYLSAFSGLIGALLAAGAIAYAAWQTVLAKRDLVRERRLEFELNLLAEMRTQHSITEFQHLAGYVGALITDPSDESDIPIVRAIVGIKSGPLGRRLKDERREDAKRRGVDVQSEWSRAATDEIDLAIQRRLEK